jgi:Spy/CpxP family protein refolding chaperone
MISAISVCSLWVLMLSSTVFAQQPGGGGMSAEDRARRQTDMMKDELKLNQDQEKKVYAINLKYSDKMKDVRQIADTSARRKSFESLNKQKDEELKKVLTADQFKSYQKLVADMRAKRQQGGPPQGGPPQH